MEDPESIEAEEPRFMWYPSEDGFGQECLDLTTCKRFILAYNDPETEPECKLIYYRTKDGKWFEWWVPLLVEFKEGDYTARDGWPRFFRVDPIVVAYAMLSRRTYGLRLPEELEPYREYGDDRRFLKWCEEQRKSTAPLGRIQSPWPQWDPLRRLLLCGTNVCRRYKRKAKNQLLILEQFEAQKWVHIIDSPLRRSEVLVQTIHDINRGLTAHSQICFEVDGLRVKWAWRPLHRNPG
jgi:hypothetical protein